MSSKVYFTDLHAHSGSNLLQKLDRLCRKAGIEQIDFKDKFVAVKVHFGEPGNMAYLRPNYSKVVCDLIKELGGKPFLTDCNTLYVGGRKNGLDHLDTAYVNGFNPLTTGVHCIIADGIKGTDERHVPVKNGEYVKEAKIGAAIADADIIVSLSHFKGHVSAGFGCALKNIGMGGGSRAGKFEMHSDAKPEVFLDQCIGCGTCQRNCANNGIKVVNGKAEIQTGCVGCGYCIAVCPKDAIFLHSWSQSTELLGYKIAEYTQAIIQDKPSFHISLLMDVSPNCDCEDHNDLPIIPDVGMFASFDPVALDQACLDAANNQPILPGSELEEADKEHHYDGDHFKTLHPRTNGDSALRHGEKIGIGTREYELVRI